MFYSFFAISQHGLVVLTKIESVLVLSWFQSVADFILSLTSFCRWLHSVADFILSLTSFCYIPTFLGWLFCEYFGLFSKQAILESIFEMRLSILESLFWRKFQMSVTVGLLADCVTPEDWRAMTIFILFLFGGLMIFLFDSALWPQQNNFKEVFCTLNLQMWKSSSKEV